MVVDTNGVFIGDRSDLCEAVLRKSQAAITKKTPDIIKFIIKRLSNLGHGEEIEMSFENKNLFWFVSENPDSKKEFN